MAAALHSSVCDLFGCRYPILLAGMGGVARSELVAAVTQGGGFGFLGMVREPVELIRSEVAALRARGIERFGVNLIPSATEAALLDAQVAACIDFGVPVVGLFWDVSSTLVARLRAANAIVVCQVGSVADARAAEQAGAQVIIAQGVEAGGHVRGDRPLRDLLADIVARTALPVLAAGGLVDGADLAAMLSLGARGAVFGTALIAAPQSFAHDFHKRRLVEASADATVLTDAFHINWPRGAKVRVLVNGVTRGERGDPFSQARTVIGEQDGRPIYLFSTDSPLRSTTGDLEAMALYAGKGVGRVSAVVDAAERVRAIAAEAAILIDAKNRASAETAASASLARFARETDDRSSGLAFRDELLSALNELLEAERAGAQVTLRTAAEATDDMRSLIMAIHHDEARWCGVLTKAILRLQGAPSSDAGAFHDKAMAIVDIPARLAFLNRGQGWVVRRLQALLPRVRDETTRADLTDMLVSHQHNIDLVATALPALGATGGPHER